MKQGAVINKMINKIINKIKQGAKTKTVEIKFDFSLFKLEIISHLLTQICKKAPKLRKLNSS